jgi:hypothetical protein
MSTIIKEFFGLKRFKAFLPDQNLRVIVTCLSIDSSKAMLKPTKFAVAVSIALLTLTTGCSVSKKLSDKFVPNPSKEALGSHLQKVGAKMYGTYWCLACKGQKQALGKQAASQITYIECDPAGPNPQVDLCRKANVTSFPTWEINGKFSCQGGCSLEKLADLSGYQGDRNFGQ